jgi:hypothetical protein
MPQSEHSQCSVRYNGDEIVLKGAPEAIHREADRIIRRFACSATPYRLARDGKRRVVLRAAD